MAKSEAATQAVTDSALTLDDALILAEFDGDTDALASLHQAIEDGDTDDLPYFAERIRQDRARREAVAGISTEWEAKGVRVVGDDIDCESLSNLTDAPDDETDMSARPALDADSHAACAGRAVTLRAWGEPVPVEVCTTPEAHHRRYQSSRYPTAEGKVYLTQLQAWGYRLTDGEKIATGQTITAEGDQEEGTRTA